MRKFYSEAQEEKPMIFKHEGQLLTYWSVLVQDTKPQTNTYPLELMCVIWMSEFGL